MPPPLRPPKPALTLRHISLRTRPHRPPPPPNLPRPRLPTDIRATFSILLFLASWYPAYSFITNNVVCVMSVTGPSMSPFLNADYDRSLVGDRVWVNMWKAGDGLERGMVVVYRSPTNPEILAVKRVVALEGDTVVTKPPYPSTHEHVPFGHVWIEGDQVDTNKTMDSNRVGPVSRSLIVGRVGGVVWPWRKAGRIRWEDWRGSERVLVGNKRVEEYTFFE